MAIKGKKRYVFYLNEENVEYLKTHFETKRDTGGLSDFIDKYISRSVWILKNNQDFYKSNKQESGKLTFNKLWGLIKAQWKLLEEHENCKLEDEIESKKISPK